MQRIANTEIRGVTSVTSSKKLNRCRSFHLRYLELCRAKNLTPLPEIRAKNNSTSVLDFFGDKLSVNDWLLIVEALYNDQILQTLSIRMRKPFGMVLDNLDTEKKAKLFRQKSVIYTKFIFSNVVEAISNCIKFNKNLRVLNLEGLPLNDKYVESIAKALSSNLSIKEISFQRSNILDKGCEAICNIIKYLENVEKLNLSECELTTKGAHYVADMIKILKINRYTESWQKSLRYRDVDPETIPGLRSIALSRNPQIGDEGIKPIVEVLKEDVWIKVIDMENCGLTDRAANMILDCLEINNYLIDFNVHANAGISKFLQRSIRDQLGKEDEDQKLLKDQEDLVEGPNGVMIKRKKVTVAALKEQIKTLEEQLAFERVLRKKAEQLNEKLIKQIIAFENQLENEVNSQIPDGYVVVKNESLLSIIRERNEFEKLATGVVSNRTTSRSNIELSKKSNQNLLETNGDYNVESNTNLIVPVNSPITSKTVIANMEPLKILKVRKVKSEVKYVEPSTKESYKNKTSKSDHELSNESEAHSTIVHIETNIGDTKTNKVINRRGVNEEKQLNNNYNDDNTSDNRNHQNSHANVAAFEFDDLSIPSTRSINSDLYSSDSDTLRNENECQPIKVSIRPAKQMPLTPMPKPLKQKHEDVGDYNEINRDNTSHNRKRHIAKSPRSLFFGLGDA